MATAIGDSFRASKAATRKRSPESAPFSRLNFYPGALATERRPCTAGTLEKSKAKSAFGHGPPYRIEAATRTTHSGGPRTYFGFCTRSRLSIANARFQIVNASLVFLRIGQTAGLQNIGIHTGR